MIARMAFRIGLRLTNLGIQRQKGQGLIEYGLIVILIAVVVIGILGLLGGSIDEMFQVIRNALPQ